MMAKARNTNQMIESKMLPGVKSFMICLFLLAYIAWIKIYIVYVM